MEIILELFLMLLLPIIAVVTIRAKDLLIAIIIWAIFSPIMAIIFVQFNAPDVGIAEAAVGAGATTILFLIAISIRI